MEAQAVGSIGDVTVLTTNGRGATPEELAERALAKLLFVSDNAPSALRIQANEYREQIFRLLVFYLTEAARGERAAIFAKMREMGLADAIPLLAR